MENKKGVCSNSVTGESAKITGKSIKKLTSGKACDKSKDNGFTAAQHFEAVSKIDTLYSKSHFVSSAPYRGESDDVVCVKRYDTPFKLKSGKEAVAHITVKEYKTGEDKIYSLELIKKK